MKKISALCLVLALLMVFQCACIPAYATETEEPTAAVEPTTGASTDSLTYGSAPVNTGCRTMEAQAPIGNGELILDTAVSAFIYERNTDTVIYSSNPDATVLPGAFAKLVTAMVAIENGDLDEEITVSSSNFKGISGSTNAKLKEGEVLTLRDLLNLMILEWANDATVTIAAHIAGSQEVFVTMMNDWVRKAGCVSTVFTNCHGLGTSTQTTTARDMARIVNEAAKNPTFVELFGATSYTVEETNKSEERKLKCLNYLMEQTIVPKYNFEGVTGGFAHYDTSSGASLVCTAEKNGLSLVVVVFGCERQFASNGWTVTSYGNYEEAWDMLEFAFDNYKVCRLLHDGQSMTQFTVSGGENDVVAQSHTSMDAVLPKDAKLDNLILKYSVTGGGLTAPIQTDQKVATMQVWYRTSCIAETDLYAMSSVRATADSQLDIHSTASRDDSNLSGVLSFIGIVFLVLVALVAVYLFVNNLRRTIARNRRRRRRKSRRRSR